MRCVLAGGEWVERSNACVSDGGWRVERLGLRRGIVGYRKGVGIEGSGGKDV